MTMAQLLSRGYALPNNNRIRNILAQDQQWQIYDTNTGSFVLAVTVALRDFWVQQMAFPDMALTPGPDCYFFTASPEYLVCSMKQGPFPKNFPQIQAFSVAFKNACAQYPELSFSEGIYIEEYARVLPLSTDKISWDKTAVFNNWISGGTGLSGEAAGQFGMVRYGISQEQLQQVTELAGLELSEQGQKASLSPKELQPFSLPGRPELEKFFNENILDIIVHQDRYSRMGISFPGSTVLHGPSGCGKTYAVDQFIKHLGWPRFDVDSSSVASSYIHDTSKKIAQVFQSAIEAAPSVLVIDEMEAFLADRNMSGPSGISHMEEVAEFLRKIPEAVEAGVLIFAMTNMPEKIDSAIMRRGRFDHIIEVSMPTAQDIFGLLEKKFRELPIDPDVDAMALARLLDGHPMSDVTFVLKQAGVFAVRRGLDLIDKDCFRCAIDQLPKQKKTSKIGFM